MEYELYLQSFTIVIRIRDYKKQIPAPAIDKRTASSVTERDLMSCRDGLVLHEMKL